MRAVPGAIERNSNPQTWNVRFRSLARWVKWRISNPEAKGSAVLASLME
jgi:hypothetical protein